MKLVYVPRTYTVTATVGELIKELQKYPEDMLVYTEGCDCTGNIVSVCVDSSIGEPDSLLIERDDASKATLLERYKDRIVNTQDIHE